MSQETRIFRGSELPRLLVLVGIMAVGWPLALLTMGRAHVENERPATVADVPPPTPPDTSPPFAVVRDRTPMTLRDNEAYVNLLARARATPAPELAARSRKDLLFTHLLERPDLYRGVPIHLEGTANRILSNEVRAEFAPKGRVYEAWVYTSDSQGYPYLLVFEDPPKGLPGGDKLHERIVFDGYFLKLMAYQARDAIRIAPMLVGRLTWSPADDSTASLFPEITFRTMTLVALAALTLYTLIRWVFQLRRMIAPHRAYLRPKAPMEEVAPEVLSGWLEDLSENDGGKPDRGDWNEDL